MGYFGDDPTGLESDEDEIPYAEGPIDNEDLMDVGPPSTSSAPPLETTNKTPISTELSLAVLRFHFLCLPYSDQPYFSLRTLDVTVTSL